MDKGNYSRFKKDNTVVEKQPRKSRFTVDNRPGSSLDKPVYTNVHFRRRRPFLPGRHHYNRKCYYPHLQRLLPIVSRRNYSLRKPVFGRAPRSKATASSLHLKTIVKEGIRYRASRNKLAKTPLMPDAKLSPPKPSTRSPKRLLLHIRGSKFSLDPTGRSLKRIDSESESEQPVSETPRRVEVVGSTFVESKSGVYVLGSLARDRVSKAVKKSINSIYKIERRKRTEKTNCVFFCRFGRCIRQKSCPYLHDPDKIAVCTRFLRGTCRDPSSCLFSHKTVPEKTPVCEYYLRGMCGRDPCLYRHVNVGLDAGICRNFVKFGHCYLKDCPNHHIMICPDFAKNSYCSKKKCSLRHSMLMDPIPTKKTLIQNLSIPLPPGESEDYIPIAKTPESSSHEPSPDADDKAEISETRI